MLSFKVRLILSDQTFFLSAVHTCSSPPTEAQSWFSYTFPWKQSCYLSLQGLHLLLRDQGFTNMLFLFLQKRWQTRPLLLPWRLSSSLAAISRKICQRSEATTSTKGSISRQCWNPTSPRGSRPAGWVWPSRRSTKWWEEWLCRRCLLCLSAMEVSGILLVGLTAPGTIVV